MDAATLDKIAIWRQKAIEGTLSLDDMKEAIKVLRQDRVGAAVTSERSRSTKAKATVIVPTADDMLAELGL